MEDVSQERLRVLFVTRKWPPAVGGMETYSAEFAEALGPLVEVEVRALPGRASGYPPTAFQLMRFLVSTVAHLWRHGNSYDVVHFGDFVLFPLAWLHWKRAPAVLRAVTVHGLDLIYGRRAGLAPAVYRRFVAWAARRRAGVELVIANSRNTAHIAGEMGFPDAVAVPLGVRLEGEKPAAEPAASPPYVLFVGRLVRRKGAAWFTEHVLPRLPEELSLHVVGKVWDRDEGRALADNPRIRVLGFLSTEELLRERRRSVAVIMPNISVPGTTDVEGFGITALEPAADGVPVLASAIEGVADAVRDGETGFLLPERDAAAWEGKIRELMAWTPAQRERFAQTAWDTVQTYFSWERVAADTVAAYRGALSRADSGAAATGAAREERLRRHE